MNALNLLKPAFDWVLHATWSASILIALILLIQGLLRDKLARRWRYALWLLVVVRLALPVSPGSAVSVFNFAKLEAAKPAPVERPAPAVTPSPSVSVTESSATTPGHLRRPRWLTEAMDEETELRLHIAGSTRTLRTPEVIYWLGFALWAPVSAFLLLRWIWQNGRFLRRMRAGQEVEEPEVVQLFQECRKLSGVRRKIELLKVEEISSPALYGVFRLRLLLPKDFLVNFQREELRHIFLHELAHVKRWDTAVNGIAAVLQMLHWFNPLVRLAFRRMALDRELACDEMALNRLKQGENQAYGSTIIKLLETSPQRLPTFAGVGILEDYRQLLTRMEGISQFGTKPAKPILALAVLGLVAAVSLTDAQTNPSAKGHVAATTRESLTRTIHLTGNEAESVLSPDESKIVFSEWQKRGADLVVKDLRTQETRRLAQVGTNWFFAETTVWSPDSKRIAYTWYQDEADEIRIASADGEENRLILSVPWKTNYYPYLVGWSRDGEHLLFERQSRGAVVGLGTIRIDSGETSVLASNLNINVRASGGKGTHARFSPDGRHVVFQNTKDGHRDIYTVRVSDGQIEPLMNWRSEDGNPIWSPDGKHVLFASDRRGQWDLWAVPVEAGKTAGEPFLLRAGFGDYSSEINAQGKLVYYSSSMETSHYLIRVDRETGETTSPKFFHLRGSESLEIQWLPDDRYCYWQGTTLHRTSLDGNEESFPTSLKSVEYFRAGHDGKWVSIQGQDQNGRAGIFAFRFDRKTVEPLVTSHGYRIHGTTADSKEVIVSKDNAFAAIDFETKRLRKLLAPQNPPTTFGALLPAILKRIDVVQDQEKKEDRLMLYDYETGETKEVLRVSRSEKIQSPRWRWRRPGDDGSPQLTYIRVTPDGRKELQLFSLDGSVHRPIPTGDWNLDDFRFRNISWDGSMMVGGGGEDELVLLSLDGKWRRKVPLKGVQRSSGLWLSDSRTLVIAMHGLARLEIGLIENYLAGSGRGR